MIKRNRPKHMRELDRLKAIWRNQVMGDLALKYLTRIVGFWLADAFTLDKTAEHFRTTREIVVFCGQAGLSGRIGCDAAEVSRAMQQLRGRKHLKRVNRGLPERIGRPPNEYLILLCHSDKMAA